MRIACIVLLIAAVNALEHSEADIAIEYCILRSALEGIGKSDLIDRIDRIDGEENNHG